ncbi:C6 finger domain [Phlyctema vagabunda]|uniref:C6 finger domain n=1 Tax=Phlyctema vagabunda TaxID=108571 RepID=A0ABR4P1C0_9HELO
MNSEAAFTAPLFSCPICSKNYSTKKSQIRHTSYCKKAKSLFRTRKKACLACTKAKTHCDSISPQCTRCQNKAISCSYEKNMSGITHTSSHGGEGALVENLSLPHGFSEQPQDNVIGFPNPTESIDNPFVFPDTTKSTDDPFEWSLESATSPFTRDMPGQNETIASNQTLRELEISNNIIIPMEFDYLLNKRTIDAFWGESGHHNAILDFDTQLDTLNFDHSDGFSFDRIQLRAPRAFQPRKQSGRLLSLNLNFVLSTLRSYPAMILPSSSSPPFIHAQFLADRPDVGFCSRVMPKPLSICQAIVQMFLVKNKQNSMFIWRAIKMEQERLYTECAQYQESETVAALQAITIYFLLRIAEKDDTVTDFDIPLITTMLKLSLHIRTLRIGFLHQSSRHRMSWETWILAESVRRTFITIFLVDLLYDITPGILPYKCDGSEFAQMILPCSRKMWRSSTRAEWEREFTAEYKNLDGASCLTYGDIRTSRLEMDFINFGDRLNNWMGQADEFGSLVVAAASLNRGAVIGES